LQELKKTPHFLMNNILIKIKCGANISLEKIIIIIIGEIHEKL